MKKIPIKLLTILILSAVFTVTFTAKTHALYIDEDGATWYTVPEMLEYKAEVDREEQELCGDDMNCKQDFFFSKIETDEKFHALEQLTQQQIVVTSVNPAEETLKVLFFDEEMTLKRMGISEKLELGEFYMGWFDNDVERIYNYGSYVEELFANVLPGAHYIYAQFDNYGDKIPANQEFKISVPGSNLNLNTSGEIAYGAFADRFNAVGRFIYTSCLTEPDYTEGTECRLMLSGEKGFSYFPPRKTLTNSELVNSKETEEDLVNNKTEGNPTNNDEVNPSTTENDSETGLDSMNDEIDKEDSKSAEATPDTIPPSNIANTEQTGNDAIKNTVLDNPSDYNSLQKTIISESKTTTSKSEITTSESQVSPQAPETGTSTASEGNTAEFPWWLKAIIGLNVAILLWLFWPSRKKPSKTTKKSKKVVDKLCHLR